jgi:hypothetical protein
MGYSEWWLQLQLRCRQGANDTINYTAYRSAERGECKDYCCANQAARNSVLNRRQTIFFSNKLHYVLFHFQTPFRDTMSFLIYCIAKATTDNRACENHEISKHGDSYRGRLRSFVRTFLQRVWNFLLFVIWVIFFVTWVTFSGLLLDFRS